MASIPNLLIDSAADAAADRTFSTISIKELLSRIKLLEIQVSVCVQSQPLLFQEASNCKLVQERLKLLERDIDQRLAEITKRIDRVGPGFGFQCLCPCRLPLPASASAQIPTAIQPTSSNVSVTVHQQPPPPPPRTSTTKPASTNQQMHNDQVISNFFKALNLDLVNPPGRPRVRPAVSPSRSGPSQTNEKTEARTRTYTNRFQNRVCPKCGKNFSTSYKRHIRLLHTRRLRFQCNVCNASFRGLKWLRNHQKKVHHHIPNRQEQAVASTEVTASTACPEEGYVQEVNISNIKFFQCKFCPPSPSIIFDDAQSLANHYTSEHPIPPTLGVRRELLKAMHKPKPKVSRGNTRRRGRHSRHRFHRNWNYYGAGRCVKCEKYFTNIYSHLQTHKPVPERRQHICTTCGKGFVSIRNLLFHEKEVHKGERPFSCKICRKAFSRKSTLKAHVARHNNGELPFACKHCGMKFWKESVLKTHRCIPNEPVQQQQRHGCDECGMYFPAEVFLSSHKLTSHAKGT